MNSVNPGLVEQNANPNLLINSDMSVWQRDNPVTISAESYVCDRWRVDVNGGSLNVLKSIRDDNPLLWAKCHDLLSVNSGTTVTAMAFRQRIEQKRCNELVKGTKATLSFEAYMLGKTEHPVTVKIRRPHGIDTWPQGWDDTEIDLGTIASGRHKATFTIPSDHFVWGCEVSITFTDGLQDAAHLIGITAVKFELGGTETLYVTDRPGENLTECMRFYETSYVENLAYRYATYSGVQAGGTGVTVRAEYKVKKRGVPSITTSVTGYAATGLRQSGEVTRTGFSVVSSSVSETAASPRLSGWQADAEL